MLSRIKQNIDLVAAGLRSVLKALMDINGYSEEDAQKELSQINSHTSGGGSLDSILGGGDE